MIRDLRARARASILYGPYIRWKYRLSPKAREKYFAGFFEQNVWGDGSSRSGSGSSVTATETLREELPAFLAALDIRSLLDLPCGDWEWMQYVDLSGLDRYVGGDVVPELVEEVNGRHAGVGREFVRLDALSSPLPEVDAVMVRDLLGHLDHRQVRRVVQNIKRSGAIWILASHYPEVAINADIAMGSWRPQNFLLEPYAWPAPSAVLWERPPAERDDKTLAAWKIASLP